MPSRPQGRNASGAGGCGEAGPAGTEAQFLVEQAKPLGVEVSPAGAEHLIALTDLLLEAARRTSLTAIRAREEVLVKHHLDSLSLCRWIPRGAARLVDVGSGAGFPGLPIAVARPELEVVLVESVLRKVRFLETCVARLGLANVRVVRERAEVLGRIEGWREGFDYATIRAVGSLALSVELCAPLVRVGGWVLVMKGPAFREEWEAGVAMAEHVGLAQPEVHRVVLPGPVERVVVRARKVRRTPERFPRRAGQLGRI